MVQSHVLGSNNNNFQVTNSKCWTGCNKQWSA